MHVYMNNTVLHNVFVFCIVAGCLSCNQHARNAKGSRAMPNFWQILSRPGALARKRPGKHVLGHSEARWRWNASVMQMLGAFCPGGNLIGKLKGFPQAL